MNKLLAITLVLMAVMSLSGCGKKQQPLEQMQEPLSMEAISKLSSEAPATPEAQAPAKVETLPVAAPQQSVKPSAEEIQTALRNANYYTGAIDGKIGPMTKKAIEDFQKANGLEADGKVGPKTWAILSAYLNPGGSTPATKKQ